MSLKTDLSIVKQGHDVNVNGTSFVSDFSISFDELYVVFGLPHYSTLDHIVDAEWAIEFSNGVILTIYNYKDGIAYNGVVEGTPLSRLHDWHIGGKDSSVMDTLYQFLNQEPNKSRLIEFRLAENLQEVA